MTRTKVLPATAIEVRAPSSHVLAFAPVETIADPRRRDMLDAANGVDLTLRRWTRIARAVVVVVGLLVTVRLLVGCTELAAIGEGARTARDVAKMGCALLGAGDGSTADVLAATAKMQQALLEASATAAKANGADARTIDGLVESVAVLARTIEANARPVVEAGGNAPAKLPPCPAAPAGSASAAPLAAP